MGERLQGPQTLKQRLGPGPNAFRAAVRRGRIPPGGLSLASGGSAELLPALPTDPTSYNNLQLRLTESLMSQQHNLEALEVFPSPRAPAAPDSARTPPPEPSL